ncbi:hypothetical protein [Okeania sp. KiyG1]|uniref:hypothetical protein n=1 Tax=Okeania sp. KiyG1 TaxID=2720165 RepID=UPI0019208D60|nr:hypothetical protein [Okeania sp. KiyG1]
MKRVCRLSRRWRVRFQLSVISYQLSVIKEISTKINCVPCFLAADSISFFCRIVKTTAIAYFKTPENSDRCYL